MTDAIAHAAPDGGPHHRLDEHLQAVARLAATFASDPTASQIAALAGLWHDLGKYRPGFQKYIRQYAEAHIEGRVPDRSKTHSAAGALWAEKHLMALRGKEGRGLSRVLQYVIAGHHAGLDNWEGGLKGRLASADAQTELAEAEAAGPPANLLAPDLPLPGLAALPLALREEIPGRFALWLRMLFSALVDADFLDTEAFMSPARAVGRQGPADLAALVGALDAFMAAKTAALAAEGRADSPVNRLRAQVLADCRAKAERPPGTFTLSVPTGGGKTLASMAFALTYAVRHSKRRGRSATPSISSARHCKTSQARTKASARRPHTQPLGGVQCRAVGAIVVGVYPGSADDHTCHSSCRHGRRRASLAGRTPARRRGAGGQLCGRSRDLLNTADKPSGGRHS